jgi:hypothetical protein
MRIPVNSCARYGFVGDTNTSQFVYEIHLFLRLCNLQVGCSFLSCVLYSSPSDVGNPKFIKGAVVLGEASFSISEAVADLAATQGGVSHSSIRCTSDRYYE